MLERAGGDVLLETIYRTIECPTAPNPRREYEQNVYRRSASSGEEVVGSPPPKRPPHRR